MLASLVMGAFGGAVELTSANYKSVVRTTASFINSSRPIDMCLSDRWVNTRLSFMKVFTYSVLCFCPQVKDSGKNAFVKFLAPW